MRTLNLDLGPERRSAHRAPIGLAVALLCILAGAAPAWAGVGGGGGGFSGGASSGGGHGGGTSASGASHNSGAGQHGERGGIAGRSGGTEGRTAAHGEIGAKTLSVSREMIQGKQAKVSVVHVNRELSEDEKRRIQRSGWSQQIVHDQVIFCRSRVGNSPDNECFRTVTGT